MVQISVKQIACRTITLEVEDPSSITIEEFTKLVSEKSGVPLARIRLSYMGKHLVQGCKEHFPVARSLNEAGWNDSKDSNGTVYLSWTRSPAISNENCPECVSDD